MIDELSQAIQAYRKKWEGLLAERADHDFFAGLQPTSVGWKTVDLDDFNRRAQALRDISTQVHYGWVNERWLATFCLRDTALPWGLRVVKLMQRRSGSNDATGLDHLDFYLSPEPRSAKEVAEQEPSLKWSEETNGDHCKWLSIWFADTEAKLRSDTVLDVCAAEMKDVERQLLQSIKQ